MSDPILATCIADEPCEFEVVVWSPQEKRTKEEVHGKRKHGIEPPAREPLQQLPNVEFQQAFLAAVKALPVGWTGTTADLHGLVPPPADHHWWGPATKAAAHQGWLVSRSTQKSELPTTNGSLVHTWERVDEHARRRSA